MGDRFLLAADAPRRSAPTPLVSKAKIMECDGAPKS